MKILKILIFNTLKLNILLHIQQVLIIIPYIHTGDILTVSTINNSDYKSDTKQKHFATISILAVVSWKNISKYLPCYSTSFIVLCNVTSILTSNTTRKNIYNIFFYLCSPQTTKGPCPSAQMRQRRTQNRPLDSGTRTWTHHRPTSWPRAHQTCWRQPHCLFFLYKNFLTSHSSYFLVSIVFNVKEHKHLNTVQ